MTQNPIVSAWLERFARMLRDLTSTNLEVRLAERCDFADDAVHLWRQYTAGPPATNLWIGSTESARRGLARMATGSAGEVEDAWERLLDESLESSGVMAEAPPSIRFDTLEVTYSGGQGIELLVGLEEPAATPANSRSAARDVLLSMDLPLAVRFGRTQTALESLIGLEAGSLIHFDRTLEEEVEVMVNGRVVARGEAVVVRGNYGVRITEVASRRDLLDTTQTVRIPDAL